MNAGAASSGCCTRPKRIRNLHDHQLLHFEFSHEMPISKKHHHHQVQPCGTDSATAVRL
jgi:hypothetical protein